MKYILPESAREYVLYQRTELLPDRKRNRIKRALINLGLAKNDYANLSYKEFVQKVADKESSRIDEDYFEIMRRKADQLLPHVPKSVSSILDIGCGIAALDIFLAEKLNVSNIMLLDKTSTEKDIWYNFENDGAFYNSLELARETLELNGVNPSNIRLIEAPADGQIPVEPASIDLVLSTISWGFHYPIGVYANSVHNILSDNGALIVDVRKGTDGIEELQKLFSVDMIDEAGKFQTVKCVNKFWPLDCFLPRSATDSKMTRHLS